MVENEIDEMVNALVRDQKFSSSEEIWPVDALQIEPLFADEFAEKMKKVIELAEDRNIEKAEIFEKLRNPSRVWKYIPSIVQGSKLKFKKEERVRIAKFLIDSLGHQMEGDIYHKDGKNVTLPHDKITGLVEDISLLKPDDETKSIISKLITALWQYAESLFYLGHNAGKEIHGPYEYEGGKLIVRDYFDLKPLDLWPDILEEFPYGSLKLLTVYDDVNFTFDIFNNYTIEGNPAENLQKTGFVLESRGGEILNEVQILERLLNDTTQKTVELSERTNNYSEEEKIIKHIDAWFYGLKDPCDLLGIDWKPNEKIYKRVKEVGQFSPDGGPPPEKILERLFDPRNDFLAWRDFFEEEVK